MEPHRGFLPVSLPAPPISPHRAGWRGRGCPVLPAQQQLSSHLPPKLSLLHPRPIHPSINPLSHSNFNFFASNTLPGYLIACAKLFVFYSENIASKSMSDKKTFKKNEFNPGINSSVRNVFKFQTSMALNVWTKLKHSCILLLFYVKAPR